MKRRVTFRAWIGYAVRGAALTLALGPLAGCGGEVPREAPREAPRASGPDVGWRPSGQTAREPFHPPSDPSDRTLLELAQSARLGLDAVPPDGPRPPMNRLIVNLRRDRSVYLKGMIWGLDEGEPMIKALQDAVLDLARRRSDPTLPLVILLRCDHRIAWSDVRRTWNAIRVPAANVGRVSFGFQAHEASEPVASRVDVDPVEGEASRSTPLGVVLSAEARSAEATNDAATAARVSIHGKDRVFAAGVPYEAGPALDEANVHWRAIRDELAAAKRSGLHGVRLRIGDSVPWAYVAMVMGLLVETGLVHVEFDGFPTFHLSTPAVSRASLDPFEYGPGTLSPYVAIGIGAGLAVAIVLIGRLGSRRRRPRAAR